MADQRLTDRSALGATPATGDFFHVVDVSDTTDNAAGTSKKVAYSDVLGGAYTPGGTDVAVADGGTGASNASGARTNLGLAIGTNVEAWDSTLDALAGFNSNGFMVQTTTDTFTARTITAGSAKISISNGNGVSTNPSIDLGSVASTDLSDGATLYKSGGTDVAVADGGTGASTASGARTNLGLVIGTDVQAWDATLSALAAYNTNGILTQTAADTFAGRTITGTSNQVTVTNGDGVSGNPTLSTPQDIHTSANPQFATLELGNASDTTLSRSAAGVLAVEGVVVPTISSTNTFTNKRVTRRVLALSANSATPSINTDSYDVVHITSQSTAITSFTSGLSGTAADGDLLRISVTGSTSIALTWGASFESSLQTLPTTTSGTTRLDIGFEWNTETSKWRCIALA